MILLPMMKSTMPLLGLEHESREVWLERSKLADYQNQRFVVNFILWSINDQNEARPALAMNLLVVTRI